MEMQHIDKHFWAIKIHKAGDWCESFSLYQLSEIESWSRVGSTHVKTINFKTQDVDEGIKKIIQNPPSHYYRFEQGDDEWRVYHNHQAILDMDDLDITYWKGYLYLLVSRCNLWGFHDLTYVEVWGHDHNDEKPVILKLEDIKEALYHIPEINFGQHGEDTFDVLVPITVHRDLFPDLGIDVVEMNARYDSGDVFQGLFAFWVDKESELFRLGFREGDVLKSITRLTTKKVYPMTCIEDLKFALEKIMYPNEKLKINYVHDGVDRSLVLDKIKYTERKFEHWKSLEKIRKAIFDIWLDIQWVKLEYPSIADDRMKDYKEIWFWVDDEMKLNVKQPATISHLKFDLNNNGKLILTYEQH